MDNISDANDAAVSSRSFHVNSHACECDVCTGNEEESHDLYNRDENGNNLCDCEACNEKRWREEES